eukprot:TRINITY_DN2284_c0_g1_i1.p2 TRINITY_DN2284_c0_g1~~TRINITY_DN2284_c0_g1_i1.p2  ORF type:complete len:142 (-),score=32.13 TRINITY_DN2284_c0_g1_i1:65-490(-)
MASEENKWSEAFQLFDRDNDGKISKEEVGTVMRALGQCPTEAEVKEIIKELPGSVDFEKFKVVMQKNKKEVDAEKELTEAFKVFDKDGKGTVQTKELRAVLTSMGEKLTEDEVDGIIKACDNNGTIHLQTFIQTLLKPAKK